MGLDAGILGGLGAGGAAGGLAGMLMKGRKKKEQAQPQGQPLGQGQMQPPMNPQDVGLMGLLQHFGNGGGFQGPGLLTNPQVPVGGVDAPDPAMQDQTLQQLSHTIGGQQPVLMDGGGMNVPDQQLFNAPQLPPQMQPFNGGFMNQFRRRY